MKIVQNKQFILYLFNIIFKSLFYQILPKFKRCHGSEQGAAILGTHVEGPFISNLKPGAHNLSNIKTLEKNNLIDTYGSLENVGIVTLAPELDGSMEVIKLLSSNGIVVSLGHTSSDMETGIQAAQNGATFITHLFNAMLPVCIFYNRTTIIKIKISVFIVSSQRAWVDWTNSMSIQ